MSTARQAHKPVPYRTADMYYAAYLKTAGVDLLDSVHDEGRVYFLFEDGPNLPDLKRAYYNRKGKVAALTYSEEIKVMKALTFETRRGA